jgi:hypothetical protein
MRPLYVPEFASAVSLADLFAETPWVTVADTRSECFMAPVPGTTYTYGEGRGVRTYTAVAYAPIVANIQDRFNSHVEGCLTREVLSGGLRAMVGEDCDCGATNYNVCFLNRYDDASKHLGWHADDSPGMDHEHPIAVVSFGEAREIWWRRFGQTGVIPADQRQLLAHGSLFIMPPGFQREFQHRIPKGDRVMGVRASLTYRHYVPVE